MKLVTRYALSVAHTIALAIIFFSSAPTGAQQHAQPGNIAELAKLKGPDYLEQLIEGAKREGTLNLYSSMTASTAAKLKADFERTYPGVKINLWRASSEALLQRTVAEARAGRNNFDVLETDGPNMEAANRENLFQPIESPRFKELIPQAVQPHHQWVATRLNLIVQCYNTKLVPKNEVPTSFSDLLSPRWKGRLGLEAGDADWFMTIAEELGEEKAIQLFRSIALANGVAVWRGHALMADRVIAGEIPLALNCYNFKIDQDRKAGAPVDWTSIGPVFARPNGQGISRKPPHPYAALLFYDYSLSQAAQQFLTALELVPVNTKIDSPIKGRQLKFIDPKRALDEQAKWDKLFNEIFIKKR
jgi:iron(III) transport system substrate-binding protein